MRVLNRGQIFKNVYRERVPDPTPPSTPTQSILLDQLALQKTPRLEVLLVGGNPIAELDIPSLVEKQADRPLFVDATRTSLKLRKSQLGEFCYSSTLAIDFANSSTVVTQQAQLCLNRAAKADRELVGVPSYHPDHRPATF